MLLQLRSNVRILSLSFMREPDEPAGPPGDPIMLLEGVTPHLEVLTVSSAAFVSHTGPRYPCVQRISCGDDCDMLFARPLIRSFPNLVWLEVPEPLGIIDHAVEERRLQNLQTQQHLRWQRLGYLGGSVPALYGLGLRCPVKILHLYVVHCLDAREVAVLPIVLRDTPPSHLVMEVDCKFPFASVINIFDGAALRLQYLVIRAYIGKDGPSPQPLFVCITLVQLESSAF